MKEPLEFFRKLRDQLQADRDTPPDALARLANANFALAETTAEVGSIPDAILSFSESLAIYDDLARDNPSVANYDYERARSQHALALLLRRTGHPAEAMDLHRKARETPSSGSLDLIPTSSSFKAPLAATHDSMGTLLDETGHPAEAIMSI